MPTVELRFGALPEHVRTARLVAAAVARRSGVGEAVVDEVKLAVGEACARAVVLHRRAAPAELVTVRLTDEPGSFVVEVVDAGPVGEDLPDGLDLAGGGAVSAAGTLDAGPLDASTLVVAASDDPSASLPPGLGLALIAGLVEDVTVTPGPGGVGALVRMAWTPGAAPAGPDDPDGASARPEPAVPEQAPAP